MDNHKLAIRVRDCCDCGRGGQSKIGDIQLLRLPELT